MNVNFNSSLHVYIHRVYLTKIKGNSSALQKLTRLNTYTFRLSICRNLHRPKKNPEVHKMIMMSDSNFHRGRLSCFFYFTLWVIFRYFSAISPPLYPTWIAKESNLLLKYLHSVYSFPICTGSMWRLSVNSTRLIKTWLSILKLTMLCKKNMKQCNM